MQQRFRELERVRVVRGPNRGETGTVVAVYGDGLAYEVEFVDEVGATVAVETISADRVAAA